jgi:hypothetical protein
MTMNIRRGVVLLLLLRIEGLPCCRVLEHKYNEDDYEEI